MALNCYTEVPKAACFILVCCLVYSSIPKIQVTRSSKMSVDFQQTSWHHASEHRSLLFNVIRYHNTEELERSLKSSA
jgi:hypothetical protein